MNHKLIPTTDNAPLLTRPPAPYHSNTPKPLIHLMLGPPRIQIISQWARRKRRHKHIPHEPRRLAIRVRVIDQAAQCLGVRYGVFVQMFLAEFEEDAWCAV